MLYNIYLVDCRDCVYSNFESADSKIFSFNIYGIYYERYGERIHRLKRILSRKLSNEVRGAREIC